MHYHIPPLNFMINITINKINFSIIINFICFPIFEFHFIHHSIKVVINDYYTLNINKQLFLIVSFNSYFKNAFILFLKY
jgi:hypothetical protein